MSPRPETRVLVWLATMLAINCLMTTAIFVGITVVKAPSTEIPRALRDTAPAQILRLQKPTGVDSWRPMLLAYQRKVEDPHIDLYAVFFVDRVKFQYPPSSLLLFDLFPRSMIAVEDLTRYVGPLKQWLDWLSRTAVGLAVLASALILRLGLRRLNPARPAPRAQGVACFVLSAALGVTFYPLLFGHELGQIQVFLNALIALALLFYLVGWRVLAGVCFGACCLVKPQYGVLLVWSLFRQQRHFTLGLAGTLLLGLTISIGRFGLADHLRYLEVVRELSRVGEAYWPNQSVNGLLNRLLENGSAIHGSSIHFAPYHPWVYAFTVLSSVALLGIALWPSRGGRRVDGGAIDLMVMLTATTLASPIAWEHHYGAFLPMFAWALPALLHARPLGQTTVPLFAFSYFTIANLLVWPEIVFRNRWLGLVGSHLFFGSLVLFGLLLVLRAAGSNGQGSTERR